jgi:hypothetical protein
MPCPHLDVLSVTFEQLPCKFDIASNSWPAKEAGETSLLRRISPDACKEMHCAYMALVSVQNTIWRFSFAFLILVHQFRCNVGV